MRQMAATQDHPFSLECSCEEERWQTSASNESQVLLSYTEYLTRSPRLLTHLHKGLEPMCDVGVPLP
jgi:hypothetical protein